MQKQQLPGPVLLVLLLAAFCTSSATTTDYSQVATNALTVAHAPQVYRQMHLMEHGIILGYGYRDSVDFYRIESDRTLTGLGSLTLHGRVSAFDTDGDVMYILTDENIVEVVNLNPSGYPELVGWRSVQVNDGVLAADGGRVLIDMTVYDAADPGIPPADWPVISDRFLTTQVHAAVWDDDVLAVVQELKYQQNSISTRLALICYDTSEQPIRRLTTTRFVPQGEQILEMDDGLVGLISEGKTITLLDVGADHETSRLLVGAFDRLKLLERGRCFLSSSNSLCELRWNEALEQARLFYNPMWSAHASGFGNGAMLIVEDGVYYQDRAGRIRYVQDHISMMNRMIDYADWTKGYVPELVSDRAVFCRQAEPDAFGNPKWFGVVTPEGAIEHIGPPSLFGFGILASSGDWALVGNSATTSMIGLEGDYEALWTTPSGARAAVAQDTWFMLSHADQFGFYWVTELGQVESLGELPTGSANSYLQIAGAGQYAVAVTVEADSPDTPRLQVFRVQASGVTLVEDFHMNGRGPGLRIKGPIVSITFIDAAPLFYRIDEADTWREVETADALWTRPDVFYSGGFLYVSQYPDTTEESEDHRFQIYDASDPLNLELLIHSSMSPGRIVGVCGDHLLVAGPTLFTYPLQADVSVGTDDDHGEGGLEATDIPTASVLSAPAPNPFNPSTRIRISPHAPGLAELCILDPRGRLVRTLLRGPVPAVTMECVWNGRDEAGRELPAGIYMVRFTQGDRCWSRGITLLK